MRAAPLPRGTGEHGLDRGDESLMGVRYHETHAGKPSGHEVFQERGPRRAGLLGERV